jgi:hypothetical protein
MGSASLSTHQWGGHIHGQDRPSGIAIELSFGLSCNVVVVARRVRAPSRIIDEDVDATERISSRLHRLRHRRVVGEGTPISEPLLMRVVQVVSGALSRFAIDVGDGK